MTEGLPSPETEVAPTRLLHDVLRNKCSIARLAQEIDSFTEKSTEFSGVRVYKFRQGDDTDLKIEVSEADGSAEGTSPYRLCVQEKDCVRLDSSKLIERRMMVFPDIVVEEWWQERSQFSRSLGEGACHDLFLLVERSGLDM